MKHENPDVVQRSAKPVRPTRRELLLRVASYFESRPDQVFNALHRIEYHAEPVIRTRDTQGTAFAPIVDVLNAAGVPTDQTLGAVMDNVPMTRGEAHELACDCNGHKMTGTAIAARLRTLEMI